MMRRRGPSGSAGERTRASGRHSEAKRKAILKASPELQREIARTMAGPWSVKEMVEIY